MTRIALTIAGVDPSGGAGILADVKTFAAFGVFPTAVITSVTYQNTQGVYGALHQTAESVRSQMAAVFDDFSIDAVKTGMLPSGEIIEEVARMISEKGSKNVVVDPVVRSTSGFDLIDNSALRVLTERLFPLADLITPNIPEAERISGIAIETVDDIIAAARMMREMGATNVLIKGGHFGSGEKKEASDYLFLGEDLSILTGSYHDTSATHGTGCTLSSAIAANLALGIGLGRAVETAKAFVNEAIRTAPMIGKGNSPINVQPI